MKSTLVAPDFGALIEFQNSETGEVFLITVGTLLQCLCVAEQQLVVPPFEPDWAAVAIPPILRKRSCCKPLGETMQ
ncbi:hypothetical protein CQ054_20080 [Ochrobactrum sp. MYb29]|nr:hypothetical protein CQ054_20080 [Ochrobactrum sp. MYb29]